MCPNIVPLAEDLNNIGDEAGVATVELSNDLVPLLSEQLYRTPIKAIEELVVNSYDAGAKEGRLFVPTPDEIANPDGRHFVALFDDGAGMNLKGLIDLWHVGRSPKRDARIYRDRKQIGKFGIGKIATYTIANRLTYVTKTTEGILASTLDFRRLTIEEPNKDSSQLTTEGSSDESSAQLGDEPSKQRERVRRLDVAVRRIVDWENFLLDERFNIVREAAALPDSFFEHQTWTLSLLENLKPKAQELKHGRLSWVLRTAMPMASDFVLYLNSEKLISHKDKLSPAVEFGTQELRSQYLEGLNQQFTSGWTVGADGLYSKSFPEGIRGQVLMFEQSLFGGKSDDLERSHGFFVRVRGRLVNLEDPLFGTTDLTHKYFSRFRADINVDDLDDSVKASREGVEVSSLRTELVEVLRALFNDARSMYDTYLGKRDASNLLRNEDKREYVPARLVEHPLADALISPSALADGADADRSWFYIDIPEGIDSREIAKRLYSRPRTGYHFDVIGLHRAERLVKFDPSTNTFTLNANHEFIRKHGNEQGRECLEDVAIAEVLLEVYLREENLPAGRIGEILQRRDDLLRSLARDRMQSPAAIAGFLRDSANDEADLEIALVAAARALGFVAKHIANADNPDGIARLTNYPGEDKVIILEAKSGKAKDHDDINFGTLGEHVRDTPGAKGCLLVVPSFKGQGRDVNENAIAKQAREARISCWTIDQLARVVECVERRHISAERIFNIVTSAFAPIDVTKAIDAVLSEPSWDQASLLTAILSTLRSLERRMTSRPRSVDMITTQLTLIPEYADIQPEDVKKAVQTLAAASRGALALGSDGETVQTLAALDELERRVGPLISSAKQARKPGQFRKSD